MCLKIKSKLYLNLELKFGVQSWKSFILILGRILCYILVVFEQDIVFGAYLTLQAESRENVDVFKKKGKLLSQFGAEILGVQSWNPQSICQITVWQLIVKYSKERVRIFFHRFPHQNPNLLKKWFMQFAENNGSQQNIASFVVTTFMKVALSSGQEQRVED